MAVAFTSALSVQRSLARYSLRAFGMKSFVYLAVITGLISFFFVAATAAGKHVTGHLPGVLQVQAQPVPE